MLRRISKESPPPIDELAEVTLRRPTPVTPTSGGGMYGTRMGPYFSRPMGPEFMRRSCTFVAEAGWRKSGSSGSGKEAKERQNLALKVRQKAAELGATDELDSGSNNPKSGRVQRLVGNVAGNLKSWSSSEDVRQSVMGAFNRTVSVITQARRSSKSGSRNSIPELTSVTSLTTANSKTTTANNNNSGRYNNTSSRVAVGSNSKSSMALKNSRLANRTSAPNIMAQQSYIKPSQHDRLNNNQNVYGNNINNHNNQKSRPRNSNTPNNNNKLSNIHHHNNNNQYSSKKDDHLFKKPTAPVGYRHYRNTSSQSSTRTNPSMITSTPVVPPGNVPRAALTSAAKNTQHGKR